MIQHELDARVKSETRAFIEENYLFGMSSESVGDDNSLMDEGIVDSTGIMELVSFIEERFRISVEDEEIVPENLDSIERISAFVTRKRETGDAGA